MYKPNFSCKQKCIKKNGFTLIELLVSMSIIVFLTIGVFVSYRNIGRRKVLDNAYSGVKSDIAFVRQLALSGVKPAGCYDTIAKKWRTLTKYELLFPLSERQYSVYAYCDGIRVFYKYYNLPAGVEFYSNTIINFYVVDGGVEILGADSVELRTTTGSEMIKTINLNDKGLID